MFSDNLGSDICRPKMGSRFFTRPENAISKAEEFMKVGKFTQASFFFVWYCAVIDHHKHPVPASPTQIR